MKKNTLLKLALLGLLSLALTACGTVPPLSWPGLEVDEANGRVYLAYQDKVTALNATSGTPAWEFPTDNNNFTTFADPVLADGMLYVGGYDNVFYALNPANGTQAWSTATAASKYIASPLADGERIYAANADHQLYALDLTGSLLWTFGTSHPLWGTPALDDGVLYVGALNHFMYAVDAASGEELWSSDTGGTLVSGPLLNEGVLYTGTFNSEVLALNAEGGEVLWRFTTDGWVWGTPALYDGQLLVGDLSGILYSLDPATGRENWRLDTGGSITGTPLGQGDNLYVINEAGRVLSIGLDGSVIWNQDFGTELYGSAVAVGDLILVAQHNNTTTLVALNDSGTRVWQFPQQ